ncbi:hypothetical protein [Aurantivibrio plasticivorans]
MSNRNDEIYQKIVGELKKLIANWPDTERTIKADEFYNKIYLRQKELCAALRARNKKIVNSGSKLTYEQKKELAGVENYVYRLSRHLVGSGESGRFRHELENWSLFTGLAESYLKNFYCLIDNPLVACQLAMPHNSTKSALHTAQNGDVTITIRSSISDLPCNSFDRVALLYFHYQALINESSTVNLGTDLDVFSNEVGYSKSSYSRDVFTAMTDRLLNCEFCLSNTRYPISSIFSEIVDKKNIEVVTRTIKKYCSLTGEDEYIPLANTVHERGKHTISFTPEFFESSNAKSFSFDWEIVKKLHKSSYALDAYILLAYLLPKVEPGETKELDWDELFALNGHSVSQKTKYRKNFRDALICIDKLRSGKKKCFPYINRVDASQSDVILLKYCKDLFIRKPPATVKDRHIDLLPSYQESK